MKYSKNFNRDWEWYSANLNNFTFSGSLNKVLLVDKTQGKSAKECFYLYDSQGKLTPTKEPEILSKVFKCKESLNFQIKEWAQDRAKGYLPKIEFDLIVEEFNLLQWMITAVERQKFKYYSK